jgi:hypothetical protein
MKILSVGCSFMCHRGPVIPQCNVMAKKLNAEIDNRSKPGNGNTHIMYNTIEAMLENNYDLVIIGWSNPLRWDYITNQQKWFAYKLGEAIYNINKPVDIAGSLFRHWSSKVLTLSSFIEQQKTKYIMFNSLECYSSGETLIHKKLNEMENFYNLEYSQIQDVRNKKQWITDDDHHPNQENQNFYANELLKKLEEIY